MCVYLQTGILQKQKHNITHLAKNNNSQHYIAVNFSIRYLNKFKIRNPKEKKHRNREPNLTANDICRNYRLENKYILSRNKIFFLNQISSINNNNKITQKINKRKRKNFKKIFFYSIVALHILEEKIYNININGNNKNLIHSCGCVIDFLY